MAEPIDRVALLVHRRDRHPEARKYRIWAMAEAWKRLGLECRLVRHPDEIDEAELLVPHVDCSYVPDEYWRVIRAHPRAINRKLRDIRKRSISPYLLSRGDDWNGPVIVKTDLNSGGYMDLRFGERREPAAVAEIRKRLAWHPMLKRRCLGWTRTLVDYPIFDHLSKVPNSAWRNPFIVVERFFEPDRDS
ncbi:MAG: hypothetical protein AAFY46_09815, partial [Planctomycetota bacterium]